MSQVKTDRLSTVDGSFSATMEEIIRHGPGPKGKDAYEEAVERGFEGTVEEWLESLRGKNAFVNLLGGKPTVNDLPPINQSEEHDAWIVEGHLYVLVEGEWRDAGYIRGEKGEKGDTGKSAYEIAVDAGFQGTIEEWLLSLRGKDGEKGVQTKGVLLSVSDLDNIENPQENDGWVIDRYLWVYIDGQWQMVGEFAGPRGKSAYDIAVDNGFIGSEQEWLESLKGESGVEDLDSIYLNDVVFGQNITRIGLSNNWDDMGVGLHMLDDSGGWYSTVGLYPWGDFELRTQQKNTGKEWSSYFGWGRFFLEYYDRDIKSGYLHRLHYDNDRGLFELADGNILSGDTNLVTLQPGEIAVRKGSNGSMALDGRTLKLTGEEVELIVREDSLGQGDSVTIRPGGIFVNDEPIGSNSQSGKFTGTWNGVEEGTWPDIHYAISGNHCSLWVEIDNAYFTSDGTEEFSISGVPEVCRPSAPKRIPVQLVNGDEVAGVVEVGTDGTLTFFSTFPVTSNSTFTTTGNKGLGPYWTITYPI